MVELYEANGELIDRHKIVGAINKAGVSHGDTVFVHTDISVFGKLRIIDRKILLENWTKALKKSVGQSGTLILPTFSYSFCEGKTFDVDASTSLVGVLTEFFRKQNDVSRTLHPIFSVAIWGDKKDKLLEIGKDAFDENSIFGKLRQEKGKILFLGAPFHSCTFTHHLEQMYNVPYRYFKKFYGKIINRDIAYQDECTYFVRKLDHYSDPSKLGDYLLDNRLMKKVKLGYGSIQMVEAEIFFQTGFRLLDEDIDFLIRYIQP